MVVGLTITAGIHFFFIEAFLQKRPLSFVDSRKDPWPDGVACMHKTVAFFFFFFMAK